MEIAAEEQDFKKAMARVMQDDEMRKQGKSVSKLLTSIINSKRFMERFDEAEMLRQALAFVSSEVGHPVAVDDAYDPENK